MLSEGHRHDSLYLQAVLDAVRVPRTSRGRPRKRPTHVCLDRGYSDSKCRSLLRRRGIRHLIPERKDQQARRKKQGRVGGRPVTFEPAVYAQRNVVERCFLKLKRLWRRVATRYEKRAAVYQAVVTFASIMLWIR